MLLSLSQEIGNRPQGNDSLLTQEGWEKADTSLLNTPRKDPWGRPFLCLDSFLNAYLAPEL